MRMVLSTSPTFGKYSQKPIEALKAKGYDVRLSPGKGGVLSDESRGLLKEADAVIVGIERIGKAELENAQKCKIIAKHGAGVDNVDVRYATERGIIVTNAPGANSDAVADMTMALILAAARGIPVSDRDLRAKTWRPYVGMEIWGKTLGLVGAGQIGKKVAHRAHYGFNMNVLAFDVFPDQQWAKKTGARYATLDEVISESDIITVHVPLLPSTKGLIGAKEIAMMKAGAVVVNTSRGGIIDEGALAAAVSSGRIGGIGIDVFEQEPPWASPLLAVEKAVLTTHIAGYTIDALEKTGLICAGNIASVLEGGRPQFVVNEELLGSR